MPKTTKVTSFEQFITEIGKFDDRLKKSKSRYLLLYRGQEKDWDLLPKIARKGYASSRILMVEKSLMQDFERHSFPFTDAHIRDSLWNTLANSQHHRLPTRLLDWSENPLIALWFACIRDKTFEKGEPVMQRVVWAFAADQDDVLRSTDAESPYSPPGTRVFQPNHVTRTITVQSGWFTLHKYVRNKKKFIALNRNTRYTDRLLKFTISSEKLRTTILRRLERLGIHSFSLFPDLYGLSDYLEWKHFKRK